MAKYIVPFLLFNFLCINTAIGQYTYPGKFQISLDNPICLPLDTYPQQLDALDQILLDSFGFGFCAGYCPFTPENSCIAKLMNAPQVTSNTDQFWCFKGDLKFKWKCKPANDVTPINVGNTYSEPAADTGWEYDPGNPVVTGNFPNPSRGQGKVILQMPERSGQISLIISNFMGKVVQQYHFQAEAAERMELPYDLKNQKNGFYSLSVLMNEEIIDTLSIMLQQ